MAPIAPIHVQAVHSYHAPVKAPVEPKIGVNGTTEENLPMKNIHHEEQVKDAANINNASHEKTVNDNARAKKEAERAEEEAKTNLKTAKEKLREKEDAKQKARNALDNHKDNGVEKPTEPTEAQKAADPKAQEKYDDNLKAYEDHQKELKTKQETFNKAEKEHNDAQNVKNEADHNSKAASLDKNVTNLKTDVYNSEKQINDLTKQLGSKQTEINNLGSKYHLNHSSAKNDADKKRATDDYRQSLETLQNKRNDINKKLETANKDLANQKANLQQTESEYAKHTGQTPESAASKERSSAGDGTTSPSSSSTKYATANDVDKLPEADKKAVKEGLKNAGDKGIFYHKGTDKHYIANGFKSDGKGGAEKVGGIKGNYDRHQMAYLASAGILLTGGVGYAYYSHKKKQGEESAQESGAQAGSQSGSQVAAM